MSKPVHQFLSSGVELAVLELPERRAQAVEIRVLAGYAQEPADKLGLANVVQQTLDKGTESLDGRALADEFDAIGAGHSSWTGREFSGFTSLCLPEYFERNVELHAAFLCRPTFPAEFCEVAVELARQDLLNLEDDPQGLADKYITQQSYGPVLGRHVYGEKQCLDSFTRADFERFWRDAYSAGRMQISTAGPLGADEVASIVERHFGAFRPSQPKGRETYPVEFRAVTTHHARETEQEQIVAAFPGVAMDDPAHAVQRILLGVLSGGMSSRLFVEVREKQGLVYWVSAWHEHPRKAGMIFVGASTTPQRCHQTYETILRELQRVGQDVTDEEVERARTGIAVRTEIRNDVTRSQCSQLADDLAHFGRPVAWEDKLAALNAVSVRDVKEFCARMINVDSLSVVTLGPRALSNGE